MSKSLVTEKAAAESSTRTLSGKPGASRLVRRTFTIALVLISGGLLLSSSVELVFRYRESVDNIWTLQREMARGAAFKIQQFVQDIDKTMRAFTQTQDVINAGLTENYRFQLIKLLKNNPAITTAVAVDADGYERYKVSRVDMVMPDDLGERHTDQSFIQASGSASYFGPVYFVRESEPYMKMAVSIEPFAGHVIGVLIAEVSLKYIWDVVSQIRVGEHGYAYVVSAEGDLIAHADISLVLQKRNLRTLSQVQAALADAAGPLAVQTNLAGNKVFAAYATIPQLGWTILLERPVEEAYAPLYASLLRTTVLLLLGLGIAALAGFWISRRVVKPLILLQQGAARIGAGDLHHRIELDTGDELEALSREFNDMTSRLRESYASLEQKVVERTRDLARSVEELQALAEIGQTVSSTLDLKTVLSTIVARAVQLSEARGGVIYEYDESSRTFSLRASRDAEAELLSVLQAMPIRLGEGIVGQAAIDRRPVQITDIDEQSSVLQRVQPVMIGLGYQSLLAIPLLLEQRIMGGLVIWRKAAGSFPKPVVDLLQTFATQSTLALQNARLFRALEQQARELEIASKHKSQFLANMSHELRTPLNAILGYTELIVDGIYGEVPDKIAGVMVRIESNGRHLLNLINEVLDLAKIEAGQLTLMLGDYSLKEVVYNIAATLEALAAEKQLSLRVDIPSPLSAGHGDQQRLSQVLLNLVGNAIKFTEIGEVSIQVSESDGLFYVAVADTGPGIAPPDQQAIFDEFQQVDNSSTRDKGGTGLGLAIAKKIIGLHGGDIGVESEPGKGATFWFRVPVRVTEQQEAA